MSLELPTIPDSFLVREKHLVYRKCRSRSMRHRRGHFELIRVLGRIKPGVSKNNAYRQQRVAAGANQKSQFNRPAEAV